MQGAEPLKSLSFISSYKQEDIEYMKKKLYIIKIKHRT